MGFFLWLSDRCGNYHQGLRFMSEEFYLDASNYKPCKCYEDFGVDLSRAASGNFLIGIIVPELDDNGLPVENILYTSITATEKLIRDLTEVVAEAKRFDRELNGGRV